MHAAEGRGDRAVARGRCWPGQGLLVVFGVSVLSGEQALSGFQCWSNESVERQRLKAEKVEII